MRQATAITVKGNDAFSIECVHRDPKRAQQVTARLATLFIEESTKARSSRSRKPTSSWIPRCATPAGSSR
jgi:uncharacterized protein involved in exopolysaccharide biosynthesis